MIGRTPKVVTSRCINAESAFWFVCHVHCCHAMWSVQPRLIMLPACLCSHPRIRRLDSTRLLVVSHCVNKPHRWRQVRLLFLLHHVGPWSLICWMQINVSIADSFFGVSSFYFLGDCLWYCQLKSNWHWRMRTEDSSLLHLSKSEISRCGELLHTCVREALLLIFSYFLDTVCLTAFNLVYHADCSIPSSI